jgi:hypothetical protein
VLTDLTVLTINESVEIKYIQIPPNSAATAAVQTIDRYLFKGKVANIRKTICCLSLYKVHYYYIERKGRDN